jgi:hypothetical protein
MKIIHEPWRNLRTRRVRQATLIEPYQSLFGRNLPSSSQWWSQADDCCDTSANDCGSLPHQLMLSELIRPHQFWGICSTREQTAFNRVHTARHNWRTGPYFAAMRKAHSLNIFCPRVVTYEGHISELPELIELLDRNVDGQVMLIWSCTVTNSAEYMQRYLRSMLEVLEQPNGLNMMSRWTCDLNNYLMYTDPVDAAKGYRITFYLNKDSLYKG